MSLSIKSQAIVDAYEEVSDKYKALAVVLRAIIKQTVYYNDYGNEYMEPDDIFEIINELVCQS